MVSGRLVDTFIASTGLEASPSPSLDSRPHTLPDGVIGNTAGFGPAIPGSSPGRVIGCLCEIRLENESPGNSGVFAFLDFPPVA